HELLALVDGKVGRPHRVAAAVESHRPQRLFRGLPRLRSLEAGAIDRAACDVLQRGQRRKLGVFLEGPHEAGAAYAMRRPSLDLVALEEDAAAAGTEGHAGQDVEQCALAAAVRAGDAEDLTRR